MQAQAVLDLLLKERPSFHGRENAGSQNYSIQSQILHWIVNNVKEGGHTLETGCGYTTILLGIIAKKHIVISPFPQEHDAIRQWCHAKDISIDSIEFKADISQKILPNLECSPLDFVLIDGDHAFPAPAIDWYYTADKVVKGGVVAVDDTHIPTGRELRQFLNKEEKRWKKSSELGKTSFYQKKVTGKVAEGIVWMDQPYCTIPRDLLAVRLLKKAVRFVRNK